jgi:hypothetical protein
VGLHKGQIAACNRTDRSGLVVALQIPLDSQ